MKAPRGAGAAVWGLGVLLGTAPLAAQEADGVALRKLLTVYATQPQGYPAGKEYARPDTSVPFRWHSYHHEAIARFEGAKMLSHVEPYNPLEGQGVTVEPGSPIKFAFAAQHVTEGKQALRLEVPAEAVRAAKARVAIRGISGPPLALGYPHGEVTASCYWCHYRWLKMDVHNPSGQEVRVRVAGVPLVLRPGFNVVAVKTTDVAGIEERGTCNAGVPSVTFELVAPATDLTLYLDHVRMEQELPAVISQRGRMFQFPGRDDKKNPVLWPGFTPVYADTDYTPQRKFGWTAPATTRANAGSSFRSYDHGLMWGACTNIDSAFRIDLPKGRYGVAIFTQPIGGYGDSFAWRKGLTVKLNGRVQVLLEPCDDARTRKIILSGEAWDFRPGVCVWEALVRPIYFPPTQVVYADVTDGGLQVELPRATRLSALLLFPEADKDAALQELGRLNFLLAESWDVSHPWLKGNTAERLRYIGFHEESTKPETIPTRLRALKLGEADFRRGFVLFQRGQTEAVYPDTIPTPEEVAFQELRCFAAPGESECVTLGILPLAERTGLQLSVSPLEAEGGHRIPAEQIDVRLSRYHQKTMIFGHHNHPYNYQAHYLVRRPRIDLHPGAARRVYLDVAVPAEARAGRYTGNVTLTADGGAVLATVPLVFELLPLKLEEPPVYFAGSHSAPALQAYGFNTFWCTPQEALKHGYKAFLAHPEKIGPAAGNTPRAFYWGFDRSMRPYSADFVQKLLKERPDIELVAWKVPTYLYWSTTPKPGTTWQIWGGPPAPGMGDLQSLENDRKAGKAFWFIDGLVGSKEQPARFTFGFWLWKLGATGRYSTLAHFGSGAYGGGLFDGVCPYYTLTGGAGGNVNLPLMGSLTPGATTPTRDLVLIREGIDDYRYLHTLEVWLRKADGKPAASRAVAEARKFREALAAKLALDLTSYYEARSGDEGGYGAENWYPRRNNPWTADRFKRARREAAEHILAMKKSLGE